MLTIPIYQVDAFTDRAFAGNPAAVCVLDRPLNAETMQAIAAEMNLSETAFVQKADTGAARAPARYGLRWFTPRAEVDLCGHATLATAAVLFGEQGLKVDQVEFETRSGTLVARRRSAGIQLEFPSDPPESYTLPPLVATALGSPQILAVARSPKLGMVLIELESAQKVAEMRPDMRVLEAASARAGGMGFIVTAKGPAPNDFCSRFFAPGLGVDEDPVTGSSHTVLTPYWAQRLGKTALRARQLSTRGGDLWVELLPRERVGITGQAVVVLSGQLRLDV
jgi:PhzF family phenazine biosynthesis protein